MAETLGVDLPETSLEKSMSFAALRSSSLQEKGFKCNVYQKKSLLSTLLPASRATVLALLDWLAAHEACEQTYIKVNQLHRERLERVSICFR